MTAPATDLYANAALLEAWRSESLRTSWINPSDWHDVAVDAVVDAVCNGADPLGAIGRLGASRGHAGVSIGEALDDLAGLFAVRGLDAPDYAAIGALVRGWAEAASTVNTWRDPASGLPREDYLRMRLAEVYGTASRLGTAVDQRLIVVSFGETAPVGWLADARAAMIACALTDIFGPGRVIAQLTPITFILLVDHDDESVTSMADLRMDLIVRLRLLPARLVPRAHVRMWAEPLPSTLTMAGRLLETLRR